MQNRGKYQIAFMPRLLIIDIDCWQRFIVLRLFLYALLSLLRINKPVMDVFLLEF